MKKYRCGKCGMTFEGKLEICPGCGAELHYVDSEIRLQSENVIRENSVSTFRYDDDDVIKTGVPENEDDLPSIQEQFFEAKQQAKRQADDRYETRRETRRIPKEQLLSEELSYYDGRKIVQFFLLIGLFFMSILSVFIAVPWAVTIWYRYDTKHTVLSGHRLSFDGTGGQLFGRYILWFFLTIITAGIFAFWLTHYMKKWKIKHTVILKQEA